MDAADRFALAYEDEVEAIQEAFLGDYGLQNSGPRVEMNVRRDSSNEICEAEWACEECPEQYLCRDAEYERMARAREEFNV